MNNWTHAIGDLAPGDQSCATFDWSEYQILSLTPQDEGLFQEAYSLLWNEFGEKGELEPAALLYERLNWDPLLIRNHRSRHSRHSSRRSSSHDFRIRDGSPLLQHWKSP